jgi:lipoprotein-anchoring transpeptidase ErfK/SrfK
MSPVPVRAGRVALAIGAMLLGACTVSDTKSADSAAAATPETARPSSAPASTATAAPAADSARTGTATASSPQTSASKLRVDVDLNARQLYLYEDGSRVETHSVAVGSAKWPTQTGEWTIKQVIFNPEWIPPDETWAEEREPRKSGDPKNPLGRAQLVYDLPRTIHGTNAPASIGKAVSHGSIRMNNTEIVALAKRLMEAGGAGKDAAWYNRTATQRGEKQVVDLPTPVPIKVF